MPDHKIALERTLFRLCSCIIICVALYFLLPLCWFYLSPFIIVLPFAAMVQPIARWLERKLHLKHSPSILIPVLLLLLVFVAIFIWFLSFGIRQATTLLSNSGSILSEFVASVRLGFERLLNRTDLLNAEEQNWLRSAVNEALAWITTAGSQLATYLLRESANFAASIPYALIYANFMAMGFYFIAKDYEKIVAHFPGRKGRETRSSIDQLSHTGLIGAIGYFRVQFIYALVTLVGSYICWTILGNPYAFIISFLAALLELIPLIGSGALYIIWSVVALLVSGISAALPPLLLYIALFVLRKITEPKIMSQNIGITPLLSLVGMFVGMKAGGILGLIAGPVLMTILVAVFQGNYLSPVVQDLQAIRSWLRDRWSAFPIKPRMPAVIPPAETEKAKKQRIPRRRK